MYKEYILQSIVINYSNKVLRHLEHVSFILKAIGSIEKYLHHSFLTFWIFKDVSEEDRMIIYAWESGS